MITAKLFVPSGAPLHTSGKVTLEPSQVNSLGSAPPSLTSELASRNVPFDDVGDNIDSKFELLGGGSPGAKEQAVNNANKRNRENIFIFIFSLRTVL